MCGGGGEGGGRRQAGREGPPGPRRRLPVFLNGTRAAAAAAAAGRLPRPPVLMAPVPVPLVYQETADGRYVFAGPGSNTDRSFLPGPAVAAPAK